MLHIVSADKKNYPLFTSKKSFQEIPHNTYESLAMFQLNLSRNFFSDSDGDCLVIDVTKNIDSALSLFSFLKEKKITTTLPTIMISDHIRVEDAMSLLRMGVFDIFQNLYEEEKLIARIREGLFKSKIAQLNIKHQQLFNTLSPREHEVLTLLFKGQSNNKIACELGISIRTVEVHRSHIFYKMNVKSLVELALIQGRTEMKWNYVSF